MKVQNRRMYHIYFIALVVNKYQIKITSAGASSCSGFIGSLLVDALVRRDVDVAQFLCGHRSRVHVLILLLKVQTLVNTGQTTKKKIGLKSNKIWLKGSKVTDLVKRFNKPKRLSVKIFMFIWNISPTFKFIYRLSSSPTWPSFGLGIWFRPVVLFAW